MQIKRMQQGGMSSGLKLERKQWRWVQEQEELSMSAAEAAALKSYARMWDTNKYVQVHMYPLSNPLWDISSSFSR